MKACQKVLGGRLAKMGEVESGAKCEVKKEEEEAAEVSGEDGVGEEAAKSAAKAESAEETVAEGGGVDWEARFPDRWTERDADYAAAATTGIPPPPLIFPFFLPRPPGQHQRFPNPHHNRNQYRNTNASHNRSHHQRYDRNQPDHKRPRY